MSARLAFRTLTCALATVAMAAPSLALQRTWIGGNADWVDAGTTANWNPADEPDADDEAIFNTANTVNLGSNNAVIGLTLSGGIDLDTNEFDLTVDGLVQLTGAGTNLFIGDGAGSVNTDNLTINSSATVELTGGLLTLDEELGSSLLDINAGGTLGGNGVITFADTPALATTLLVNDGTISAFSRSLIVFQAPPVGTLQINDSSVGGRVDLDGASETGVVNVNRNQTLDLNVPLSDAFNGTMNLLQNASFDSTSAWTLAGGAINIDNGATGGIPSTPAGPAFIKGGALTQSGGVITVIDTDGTLQFDSVFTMNGGSLVNEGHVIFNANATINNAATFTMGGNGSDLTVSAGVTATINQTSINLDGNFAGTVITVNDAATLDLNLGDYDNDAATNGFDATIVLNGGDIDVNTSDAAFVMNGSLVMETTSGGNSAGWFGEPLQVGNDLGSLDADIQVNGNDVSQIGAVTTFKSDADVNISAGATLQFLTNATVNFDTVNGGNNAEFTGAGHLDFNGQVNVNEAVTLNMVGGFVDLDGSDGTGEFINIDAPMTINAATLFSFGRVNGGGGVNTLDINNSVGSGVLTVNLDSPTAEWTLNGPGVMNLVNDNTEATLLAGSDVNINGTVNVTGDVRSTARLDIAGVINISTAGQPLRLAGGNNIVNDPDFNPNTIAGGVISGAGLLGADGTSALIGFGAINTGIDFDSGGNLFADNGILTINGPIVDVNNIGTLDGDGILNVPGAWNSGVANFISLRGGEVRGGTITVDNGQGITGSSGKVASRVVNNTRITASGTGGTLLIETAANDNDWDGAAGGGRLGSVGFASTLELRDNATFGFTGIVDVASGSRVFANGFALDFNPGSFIQLSTGTYESTSSTDIGGAVTVVAGAPSTVKVANNFFLTFENTSATTLGADLVLQNNNINIEAGATFSGTGALVIDEPSHAVLDNGVNINALFVNEGSLRPGNFEGIGTATVKDYVQTDSGELFLELTGTLPNQFDRLLVSQTAQIDGYLNIDIDEVSPGVPFNPALGTTFDIIQSTFGVSGTFDTIDVSGLSSGKAFAITYLPNSVRLTTVVKPEFAADFDDDGDVDATDYVIWTHAYALNQLGDANGDNISDAADYTIWRDTLGSGPSLPSVAIPEPTAAVLLALASGLPLLCRRR